MIEFGNQLGLNLPAYWSAEGWLWYHGIATGISMICGAFMGICGPRHDYDGLYFFASALPIVGIISLLGHVLGAINLLHKKKYFDWETVTYFLPVAMLSLLWVM